MADTLEQYGAAVARRVARARQERGWTQDELALLSGVGRKHVSLIEGGKLPRLTVGTAARLAGALAVSVDWLLELTDDPQGRCPCTTP